MTINYDEGNIAQQYRESKKEPWRLYWETFSFLKQIGDLKGKKVVDIACGDGYFTRLLDRAGAEKIVGFDISEKMVKSARQQEKQTPLGIEYRIADARKPIGNSDFDVAVSAWLLVYAHNRAELDEMCRGIASWLRVGGRFVTFTTNPNLYFFPSLPNYRKYGFEISLADKVYEGAPILWKAYLKDSVLDVENYYLPIEAYQESLSKAGLENFKVHQAELSPEPYAKQGFTNNYWQDLLKAPPAIIIDCVKTR